MRTGGVRYGKDLDALSYILHHIIGKVRQKTNACGQRSRLHVLDQLSLDSLLVFQGHYKSGLCDKASDLICHGHDAVTVHHPADGEIHELWSMERGLNV